MKLTWVSFIATVCAAGLVASSAAAAKPASCSKGDAQSAFEAPFQHLVGNPCQYRLFWDGQTRTFCQGDFILGGVNYFDPYKADGLLRKDVIASIEQIQDFVWIDGVQQPLMQTAFKDGVDLSGDIAVYQQRGFIAQLPVGVHTSLWKEIDPVYGVSTATVTLDVLPGSDPACSG